MTAADTIIAAGLFYIAAGLRPEKSFGRFAYRTVGAFLLCATASLLMRGAG